jgi:hypothetical protein
MKNSIVLSVVFFLVFTLSACGSVVMTPISPSAESVVHEVNTSVAAPITAQIPPNTPAPTATPTATATPQTIPTQTVAAPITYFWTWSATSTNYTGCADATFIKDVTIPDETILAPGETFEKTWRIRNTGSCTWASNFQLVFVDGDEMDGSDTTIDKTVYSNKKADISITLIAPDDEGIYVGYWELADEGGNIFGDLISVTIVVVDNTATSTPTSTFTPTSTATLTPTAAWTSTYTVTPTATEIFTATATSSFTPVPTSTEIPTATSDPTAEPSATASSTPPISTETPLPTPTATETPILPGSPTSIPATETPLPTEVPTGTPAPTLATS